MTSVPTEVSDGPRRQSRSEASRLLMVGRLATAAALLACVLLQWIDGDWFPPEVSVSQYGVGRFGWILTCWTTLLAVSVVALTLAGRAAGARQPGSIFYWLAAGSTGLLVMGIVRTDAGGAQHSWHAKVHMIASIVALLAMPVVIVLALHGARRPWRRMVLALTAISAIALVLVLSSAVGVRTLGLDAQHSWAFWQAVAVTVDMILVAVLAMAGAGFGGGGREVESTRGAPR